MLDEKLDILEQVRRTPHITRQALLGTTANKGRKRLALIRELVSEQKLKETYTKGKGLTYTAHDAT